MTAVVVYAIAKNEAKHVARFMERAREADRVVVVDTGSDDGTVALLQREGAEVHIERFTPFHFARARNRALDRVNADPGTIMISLDLDEVPPQGWRRMLEDAWIPEITRFRYPFVWSRLPDGRPDRAFFSDKAHMSGLYRWKGRVHEVLVTDQPETTVTVPALIIEHLPDPQKSRSQYLGLLMAATSDDPDDARMQFYLAREYMLHSKWKAAVPAFARYLQHPNATWKVERSAAMRFMGYSLLALGVPNKALEWLSLATQEAPSEREPWLALADVLHKHGDPLGAALALSTCLRIQQRPGHYLAEGPAWGDLPHAMLQKALMELAQCRFPKGSPPPTSPPDSGTPASPPSSTSSSCSEASASPPT